MILSKPKASKRFSLKIASKSCKKGLKYCKFTEKDMKQKTLWKKVTLKGNVTKYIEYKHKNTGTSSCKSICVSKLQCFNSSMKCWKTVLLKPFGLSVWNWFSRLVCFVFTSFLLEKNLWTHDKLDIRMHKKKTYEKQQHHKNISKYII